MNRSVDSIAKSGWPIVWAEVVREVFVKCGKEKVNLLKLDQLCHQLLCKLVHRSGIGRHRYATFHPAKFSHRRGKVRDQLKKMHTVLPEDLIHVEEAQGEMLQRLKPWQGEHLHQLLSPASHRVQPAHILRAGSLNQGTHYAAISVHLPLLISTPLFVDVESEFYFGPQDWLFPKLPPSPGKKRESKPLILKPTCKLEELFQGQQQGGSQRSW